MGEQLQCVQCRGQGQPDVVATGGGVRRRRHVASAGCGRKKKGDKWLGRSLGREEEKRRHWPSREKEKMRKEIREKSRWTGFGLDRLDCGFCLNFDFTIQILIEIYSMILIRTPIWFIDI